MKRRTRILATGVVCVVVAVGVAGIVFYRRLGEEPSLALELLRMRRADVAARKALPNEVEMAEEVKRNGTMSDETVALINKVNALDRTHTARLKEIVS